MILAKAPISAIGSNSVEDRIILLERIYNAHSQILTQLQQQFSDNQSDIDILRGQIQENQHHLNQVVQRQEQIVLQIRNLINRLAVMQSATIDYSRGVMSALMTNAKTISNLPIQKLNDVSIDYNLALTLVKNQYKQDDALVALHNFLKKYPNSIYQPNVNYWLGQISYNKNRKADAVFYFSSVVKNYPKSSKAPAAMFKVGTIMEDKKNIVKAKTIYKQVINKYPNTSMAKQAQKRLDLIG